jgi:bifunctional DNase/RNase
MNSVGGTFECNVQPVELFGIQVDPDSGVAALLLREEEGIRRVLPIFVAREDAVSIALAVSGEAPPRPSSHDLMTDFVQRVGAQLEAVEVTDLEDDTFFAALTFRGPEGVLRLEGRPSDAIALAVRADAPMFVADAVLDRAGALLPELDDEAIDREVEAFRAEIDEFDPSALDDVDGTGDAGLTGGPVTDPDS